MKYYNYFIFTNDENNFWKYKVELQLFYPKKN